MKVFGKDWTVTRINDVTFTLRCEKESVTVCKSPAGNGSWFAINKGSWLALTFHLDNNNLVLGAPKR